jgi:hypothetical protein
MIYIKFKLTSYLVTSETTFLLGLAMSHAVSDLSPWRFGFIPRSVHVGFVMHKVTLGQVSLRVVRFSPVSPVNIISPCLSTLIYHLGMNNGPVGGLSSETYSHSNDMKNLVKLKLV